jgi:hypothetical protein
MGHRSWTASSIGDPVSGMSLEPEITKSTRSLWPTRRIAESTPTTTTTLRARSEIDAFRHRRKDTDWQDRVLPPLLAAADSPTMRKDLLHRVEVFKEKLPLASSTGHSGRQKIGERTGFPATYEGWTVGVTHL